jgi:hypothetical protein
MRLRHALACALLGMAVPPAHAQSALSRGHALSAADCASPADMVVETDPAPLDRTYMRVQHMGDPGTVELQGQVANAVTWDVGRATGLEVPAAAQRGFRDAPPPAAANAFQLWCDGAGFLIDTASFPHHAPLVGEGPSVSIARDFSTPLPAFRNGASLAIEATVRLPTLRNQRLPVISEGTAQLGFFYYVQDSTSGVAIAQLVALFDNRPAGVDGSGVESILSDGHVAFMTSPLATADATGRPVRYVTYAGVGPATQLEQPWTDARTFVARITPANFRAALETLRAGPLPQISPDPADYRVLSFGVLGEVFPGTGDADNVAFGASVTGLALREVPLLGLRRH